MDVILRSIRTLKKIGTPTQKKDAEDIERRLAATEQPEAVSFATAEDDKPEDKK